MKMKKLLCAALAALMVLALAACGEAPAEESEAPAAESEAPAVEESAAPAEDAEGEKYVVGICQLAPHTALDAATQGFTDALTAALGDAVEIKSQNAGGEQNNCITIIDGYVAEDVDLILANATGALQAAASATADIPVLGTAVTNYAIALGLDDTMIEVLGNNISGTSDLAPLDQQAAMVQELFPDAGTVGLLYCSAEPNSVYQIEVVQAELEALGYATEIYAFTDVNDLASVTQTACDNCDVIYIPTDNTAANNTESIANVVLAAGVPVIAGESGICSGCGVATLSIDYYELGQITGEMAVQILTGEADVSEMAIGYDETVTKMYNPANCEALGVVIPEGYEPLA